jgi:hypothetical protein
MNIFTFIALGTLAALLPAALAGALFLAALADGRRITRGEPPRRLADLAHGVFIRERRA